MTSISERITLSLGVVVLYFISWLLLTQYCTYTYTKNNLNKAYFRKITNKMTDTMYLVLCCYQLYSILSDGYEILRDFFFFLLLH